MIQWKVIVPLEVRGIVEEVVTVHRVENHHHLMNVKTILTVDSVRNVVNPIVIQVAVRRSVSVRIVQVELPVVGEPVMGMETVFQLPVGQDFI